MAEKAIKKKASIEDHELKSFNPGDLAVYPAHGVGMIESIESREIGGEKMNFYIMNGVIRHIQSHGRPVLSAIYGNVHAHVGTHKQEIRVYWILPDYVDRFVGQISSQAGPGFAVVFRDIYKSAKIIAAVAGIGHISFARMMV